MNKPYISFVVKGSEAIARDQMLWRAIVAELHAVTDREAVFNAPYEYLHAIQRWFNESPELIEGFGYPVGTCLLFSIHEFNPTVLRKYNRLRAKGWRASEALRNAKVAYEFAQLESCDSEPDEPIAVRLRIVPDECADIADLDGDTFDPDVNTDIPASKLAREQKEHHDRIARDGVWGVIGEYWNGTEWEMVDSCFGFVGDDWIDSGYDTDIKHATITAARNWAAEHNA